MTAPLLLLALAAGQPPGVPTDKDGRPDFQAALNARLGKGITPERNAVAVLWTALGPTPEGGTGMPPGYFDLLGVPEPPKDGDYYRTMTAFARTHHTIDEARREFTFRIDPVCKRPWKAADFPDTAAWLAANEKPLAVVAEAARRPAYFNPVATRPVDGEHTPILNAVMPTLGPCRDLAVSLTARAMLRLGEGKTDDAWKDLLTCHRLGRLIARGGSIEGLVGTAVDHMAAEATVVYVARAGLSVEQLRARLKEFQALPPMPPFADRLDVFVRLDHLDSIQYVRRGDKDDMTPADRKMWEELDWAPVFAAADKTFDRLVAAERLQTRAERGTAAGAIMTELEADAKPLPKPKFGGLFGGKRLGNDVVKSVGRIHLALCTSSIGQLVNAADRAEQVNRNTVVAIALAAYHKSEGRYPATLDVLAPRFLTAVPGDVFAGRPLVYRRDGAGYLLYSFGANEKDDGGRGRDDDPPGDDWRVRMPPAR